MKTVSQEFSEILQKNSFSKFSLDQMSQVDESTFDEKNLNDNQSSQSSDDEDKYQEEEDEKDTNENSNQSDQSLDK